MKDKMFVIPGPFVPYNDTITLLTYKRLRNLDVDMDVFAMKSKVDLGLLKELESDPNFRKFSIKYTDNVENIVPRNHPYRLPIGLVLMNKYVQDALKEYEKKNYKYLFTSIVPGISHIAGKKIKDKHPEVIWYASFSDPFKGSPYKKTDLKNRNIFYKIGFNVGAWALYNDKYEEVAVLNADKLVFICEEQRDFTLKQYQNYEELKKKSIIMPLTYISEWKMYSDLLTNNEVYNSPKQAVHLGRLYGMRKIDTFLIALKEMKEENKDLSKQIVFHQYSEIQEPDVRKIEEYHLEDVFILHNKVSYQESIEIMKKSDILVLFDTLMPNNKIQPYLPSKIVEYLMLKKPILGICGENSPSYRILKDYNFNTIGYTKEEIKKNIKYLISNNVKYSYSLEQLISNNYNMLKL